MKDYFNMLNRQPEEELMGFLKPLSPLEWNEKRAESHYSIQEVRREIEDEKRKIDNMRDRR